MLVCRCAGVLVCRCAGVHVCMYACVLVCMYVCLCACMYVGVWGRGAQTGNSLKRGVCVCASVWPVWREVADARWANPELIVYCFCCFCCAPDPGRPLSRCCLGFVSVLSRCCLGLGRFCLGFVSVLSRLCAPPTPTNSLSPNGWRYRYIFLMFLNFLKFPYFSLLS